MESNKIKTKVLKRTKQPANFIASKFQEFFVFNFARHDSLILALSVLRLKNIIFEDEEKVKSGTLMGTL